MLHRGVDLAFRHLGDECSYVLAQEEELVRLVPVAAMDRHLRRRQAEDEVPAIADMRQLEHVTQESVIGLGVGARDDYMRAADHDVPNLSAALALARAASTSRSRGSALVCRESSSLW